MNEVSLVAAVGRGLADESRVAMCLALLDGVPWTVSALAAEAGVRLPTASEHVARLVRCGLVQTTVSGRHKYVRLAGPQVAEVLETLCGLAEPARPQSLSAVRRTRHLAAARTCYDHLAGRLGVAVLDGLLDAGVLRRRGGLVVTRAGRTWFDELGISVSSLEAGRRPLLRDCLDLTERRPHLAGSLGAGLCSTFLARGWVRRTSSSRALAVTPAGERAAGELLGIAASALVVA
ncbi:MAG TPA: winged helix-turn-helix domain-containing protein [Nocardioidaceae bacterium]|nr:winged helix-turn-helix domain-containing protein [Nocardioidaceae bacterium]